MLYKIKAITLRIFNTIYSIIISLVFYKDIRVYLCNHFTIGLWNLKKLNTRFPHPVGIVIGMKVKMGRNCTIYQNVTIGTKDTENYGNAKYPTIGDNVTIYANSVIFGDISIGENSVIGAGSVIFINIPPNSIAVGNPAKILSKS